LYKTGKKNEVIVQLFSRNKFSACDGENILSTKYIPADKINLRAANTKKSMFKGILKFFCTRKCHNNKFICKKETL
jgi:hypothetical protein